MNSLIFLNTFEFLQIFKNTFSKKKHWGYNREIVKLINRKIVEYDMDLEKNIFEIRNNLFSFEI